jgi:hypothetical protein
MIELIVGAILGTIGSLVITHIYYRKSSHELEVSITVLKSEIEVLQSITKELQEGASVISSDTEIIRRHAVAGTPDDPEYPYK